MPSSSLKLRKPGLATVAWGLGLVLLGAALGFGLNLVSPVGINLHIALGLDDPAPAPIATPAPGAKP